MLALERRQIPPTAHFTRPNPRIDFAATPFQVAARLLDWPAAAHPRRAGVSAFGIGGTNAHVVLEEAPAGPPTGPPPARPAQLLLLSAASRTALEAATANLARHLRAHPELELADVAYTLQVGRKVFAHRRSLVCGSLAEAAAGLETLDPKQVLSRVQEAADRQVAFLFPGQGSQYAGMGAALYRQEATYRREVDRCAELLHPALGLDLRELLHPAQPGPDADLRLAQTCHAQPALFVVSWALARLWMEWGVRPQAMLGHSVGELVAACLAGVFTLEEALDLVAARGRLMQAAAPGAMLSVPLPAGEVRALLAGGLEVAAVNTPALCAVAGPEAAIAGFAARLAERGVACRRLHTSHAFHSASMEPVLPRFRQVAARLRLRPPQIPFLSNRTGTWIGDGEATDPEYWGRHLREPVQFAAGLDQLFARPALALLEVGPGRSLAALARQHPGHPPGQLVLSSLPAANDLAAEPAALLRTLGQLWLAGVQIDWGGTARHERRRRLALPTYPFERRRYWIEPRLSPGAAERSPAAARRPGDWFYVPLWQQAPPPPPAAVAAGDTWLLFIDRAGVGEALAARLRAAGARVATVRAAAAFAVAADGALGVRPAAPEDYAALVDHLRGAGLAPRHIAHLWGVTAPGAAPDAGHAGVPAEQAELASGFYSLLHLAQALSARSAAGGVQLGIVSTGLHRVTGDEPVQPLRATLLGPALTVPQELPGLTCRSIDLTLPEPGGAAWHEMLDLLQRELAAAAADAPPAGGGSAAAPAADARLVAYRGGGPWRRWLRAWQPLALPPPPQAGDGGDATALALREQGVYLITGGLGGVGLEIAELLAGAARARLVLLGRTPLPERSAWPRLAAAAPAGDATAAVLRRLLALEEGGAQVLAVAADVTDEGALAAALRLARERFGPLHGAIHAAGVAGAGLLEVQSAAAAAATLAPKVTGTLVLARLLAGEELDFFILCSSLNALLGGPGQVAYAAANAFLDAFAESRDAAGTSPVMAIAWDAWRGVGMAARGARPAAGTAAPAPNATAVDAAPALDLRPFDHPLLAQRAAPGGGGAPEEIFLSRFQAAEDWILAEHRLGGQAIVPGTAYLEMAGAAFRSLDGSAAAGGASGAFELRDVAFVAPMQVGDDEPRAVRTTLRRNGDGFHFHVRSAALGNGQAWQEHVAGTIAGTAAAAARFDLPALIAGRTEQVPGDDYREDLRLAGLGPRWESLKKVYVDDQAVLARLELAPEFSADVERFHLHPALLDVATCFAEAYAPRAPGYYLPLSYRRLRVHGRLPGRLWSYARFRQPARSTYETIAFDVAILDDDGVERVHIEEFTLKRVDVAGALRERPRQGDRPAAAEAAPAAAGPAADEGLAPAEAVEALRRILAARAGGALGAGLPPVLAVSAAWLPEAIHRARGFTLAQLTVAPAADGGAAGHARPDLATAWAAPRSAREERLVAIWEQILGIDGIGVFDDFFDLGGHSLLGTQLVSRLRTEMQVEVPLARLFEAPTVAELAAAVEAELARAGGGAAAAATAAAPIAAALPPIAPRSQGGPAPLSFPQQRLWFLDRLDPGSPAYNMARGLRLWGRLGDRDLAALAAAIAEIVRRHQVLRATFQDTEAAPAQVAGPPPPQCLPLIDLSGLPDVARQGETRRRINASARQPFDLATGPPLRTLVLRLAADEHVVSVVMHHIVTDGWSMGIFVREIWQLYPALRAGLPSPLPELALQYADFAAWQREWLAGEVLAGQLALWTRRLSGAPHELILPCDRPRPAMATLRGGMRTFTLPAKLAQQLALVSRRAGATLAMTLLAGFQALLARYSGQHDLLLGVAIAGRNRREIEELIGFFVNTLVFRAELAPGIGFGAFLEQVRQTSLEAYANQDLPFEQLVEELHPARNLERHPLFQVMFGFETLPREPLAMPGISMEPLAEEEIETGASRFDLAMSAFERDGGVGGVLEYSADLFDGATILRLARHYAALLTAATADPAAPIATLDLLSAAERQQLTECNATGAAWRPAAVHQVIAAQARRTPDAVALAIGAERLSYGELERRAGHLARRLAALGVGGDTPIGLCTGRSFAMVVGMLAILQAGAAYLPLDPEHPAERLAWILADACAPVVVTEGSLAARLPAFTGLTLTVDEGGMPAPAPPAAAAAPPRPTLVDGENLAYVIYTSGSTGRPKGVEVRHAAVANYLASMAARPGLGAADVVAAVTTLAFDIAVTELLLPLTVGARIEIVPHDTAIDARRLAAVLAAAGTTCMQATPATWTLLLDGGWQGLPGLRALCGGEALPRGLADRLLPRVGELWNLYGPTETTVWSARGRVGAGAAPVPLGLPLDNTSLHILPAAGGDAPLGVAGELAIGGDGVARGYHGRPDLTAERFVPDPTAALQGARLYRTGDLARRLPDGTIHFLGRLDHQVKIRGFRIELGEIEAVLAGHRAVRETVAVARLDAPHDPRLAAYAVLRVGEQAAPEELLDHLRRSLPAYMVPAWVVLLDALPRNPSGKVDRQALPAPAGLWAPAAAYAAPLSPIEDLVCDIWAEVLGLPRVSRDGDFFALGGHSLLATRAAARLLAATGVELPLRLLFESPRPAEVAGAIAAQAAAGVSAPPPPPLRAVPRGGDLPLSFAQERLWLLDQLQPGGTAYNLPVAARLAGRLDRRALGAALGDLVRRHEALRTRFAAGDAGPVQVVDLPPPGGTAELVPEVDLEALAPARRERVAAEMLGEVARRPFDLERGPLLRQLLLRLADEQAIVLLVQHHIVSDLWSIGVLLGELEVLYAARSAGHSPPLAPPAVQYGDFTLWQRRRLDGAVVAGQIAWWRERLAGAPGLLDLPADRPRPAVQSYRGGQLAAALPAGPLRQLARERHATLFMVLLAGVAAALSRLTGQEDLSLGSPIAGRTVPETEGLVGFLVNTLVLRLDLAHDPSFGELLGRVRDVCIGAYSHQELPFERLVEELAPERSLAHSPLFQVLVALQNAPDPVLRLAGLAATPLAAGAVDTGSTKFDLSLTLADAGPDLAGTFEYARDLFDHATVAVLCERLERLLCAAAADPERRLSELPLAGEAERQQLLEWNATAAAYDLSAPLDQLFAAQARRTPETIAVQLGGASLCYAELDVQADRLARRLRRLGVAPRALVGICVERSPAMIVGLLAILKARAAYVPLDPDHPRERLAAVLQDARIALVLTTGDLRPRLPAAGADTVLLDRLPGGAAEDAADAADAGLPAAGAAHGDDLAYVIFTSGSTGRPKGAMNSHRAVVNRLLWMQQAYPLGAGDAVLQKTPFSFDVSVWELFWPLLTGAREVLAAPGGHQDPAYLAATIAGAGITTVHFVPAMLRAFLDAPGLADCRGLRRVIASGEALPADLAAAFHQRLPGVELHNLYGPTEAAIDVTAWPCRAGADEAPVPIGRPIANLHVHLLDRALHPTPVGAAGELWIGGVGLARGYVGRPELTAERFLPAPDSARAGAGARLYRSGDLARVRRDGAIEYLGRLDHQVKIRGFRIELGEIEAVLATHPRVGQAVVVARGERDAPGGARLVAYVQPAGGAAPAAADLVRHLQAALPLYMVPASFVLLDELPRNANGKVDRRALPAPAALARTGAAPRVPPRTPYEELVCRIWEEVLGGGPIGVYDNFFKLGGHSLLAAQVVARLRRELEVPIPLRAVFNHPTAAGLAEIAAAARRGAAVGDGPPLVAGCRGAGVPAPLSYPQLRFWQRGRDRLTAANTAYGLRLLGRLDAAALVRACGEIVRRHDILRTSFAETADGPVQLVRDGVRMVVAQVDLGALAGGRRSPELARLAAEAAVRPFALDRAPLLRTLLVRLAAGEHALVMVKHHLIIDGWSEGVLVEELTTLYQAFIQGLRSPLAELPVQYGDFAAWQRARLDDGARVQLLAFWRRRLQDLTPLPLPYDRPRQSAGAAAGAQLVHLLGAAETGAVRELGRREGASMFMTLLAAWQALLSLWTGGTDFALTTNVAGRDRVELEPLIGLFTNVIALRTDVGGDPSFREVLRRARETTLGAFAHQDLPWSEVVDHVLPGGAARERELLPAGMVLQNFPFRPLALAGIEVRPLELPAGVAVRDVFLMASEEGVPGSAAERLQLALAWLPGLFTAATARALLSGLVELLAAACVHPEWRLSQLAAELRRGGGEACAICNKYDIAIVPTLPTGVAGPTLPP